MISAPSHPHFDRAHPNLTPRRLRIIAASLATVVAAGLAPTISSAAAPAPLILKANSSAWAKIGPSRTTQIAQVVVTAPGRAVELGLQFRADTRASGYRTKVKIAANGAVSGTFSRVAANKQSDLSGGGSLGFSVAAGQRIRLEATVAGKDTVNLFLRAWKDGTKKPSTWQLVAKDSSSKKITRAGALYLWAKTPAGSPRIPLKYSVASVAPFTLAKALQVGLPPAKPQPADPGKTFSIAVIGDTQEETGWPTDPRFPSRTAWLAAHRESLNLRYAIHTGDMVNWGWLAPNQYTLAKKAMSTLTRAGVPYSLTVGNHDTRAVGWDGVPGSRGYGGSAYVFNPECVRRLSASECDTKKLVRKTAEFNDAFPLGGLTADVGGTFEYGKVDNTWSTFSVDGTKWLVLSLEFAPRKTAVEWGRKVVAAHPNYNVILSTHFYLNGNGTISNSNAGYGETSGTYIYDRIVSKYANVKIVTSGHTGGFTRRVDTIKGNKVISYLGNSIVRSENPLRILTINTKSGVISNTVYRKVVNGTATRHSSGKDTITIIR